MTILSQSTRIILTPGGAVFLVIGSVFFLMAFIAIVVDSDFTTSLVLFLIAILSIGIALVGFSKRHDVLKVTLSNDYPAISLYNEFDITNKEGDIWTLTRKEPIKDE